MNSSGPASNIWVIIVTYNGAPWIERCLVSVLNSTCFVNVIAIDNCSTDDTVELIRAKFPSVTLIVNDKNAGFGAANNIGIKHALRNNAEFVFLLNQDTTIEKNTISVLLDAWRASPSYAILSPMHLGADGDKFDFGFATYLSKHYSEDEIIRLRNNLSIDILRVGFVNAASWFIPVGTLEKIGGFAPLFFHYGEDRDYVNRLNFNSRKIGVVNNTFIRHYRDDRNMNVRNWSFEKRLKYYYVGWLTRAADITSSSFGGWWAGCWWAIKEMLVQLFKLKANAFVVFLKVTLRMISVADKLSEHRRTVMTSKNFKFLQ